MTKKRFATFIAKSPLSGLTFSDDFEVPKGATQKEIRELGEKGHYRTMIRVAQEARRLGRDCHRDRDPAICVSVPGAVVARFKEERRKAGDTCRADSGDASYRCDLADRAGLSSREFSFELDGHRLADRHRGPVDRDVCLAIAEARAGAAQRSAVGGGAGASARALRQ